MALLSFSKFAMFLSIKKFSYMKKKLLAWKFGEVFCFVCFGVGFLFLSRVSVDLSELGH